MRKSLPAMRLLVLLAGVVLAGIYPQNARAGSPDWSKAKIQINRDSIWVKPDADIISHPRNAISLVKVTVADGRLVVDLRDFKRQYPQGTVTLRSRLKDFTPGAYSALTANFTATPAGEFVLFYEGATGDPKKSQHYWQEVHCLATPEAQDFSIARELPADVRNLRLRADFTAAAVYILGNITNAKKEHAKEDYDPAAEQIANGGAERGLYGIIHNHISNLGSHQTGTYFNYLGKELTDTLAVSVDDRVFHSGKRSFKIIPAQNGSQTLHFQPVRFIKGIPLTLSLYAKASAKTRIALAFFPNNGVVYTKDFNLDTEWKKCVITIPEFGKTKIPGVMVVGNPADGYGARYGLVCPRVDVNNGATVWIDDVSCRLDKQSEFKDEAAVWIGGVTDKPYYVGTESAPRAKIRLEAAQDNIREAEVSWQVLDFFGKTVVSGAAEKITLPADKEITPAIPATTRGWLTLQVDAKTAGRTDTHTVAFGVIDAAAQLDPRWGVNIDAVCSHNTQKSIAIMKDFRLGAARVWNFNFRGFRGVADYHDAGIFTLFCLQHVNQGEKSLFMPKDWTEWKKYLTENVAKVKGRVDAYEILNEPNIWSGRKVNPDPANLNPTNVDTVAECGKVSAEAIRAVDQQAKIAGPDTCGTNVPWIETAITKAGAGTYDIISEHPYRQLPELPDYGVDMQNLQKMAKRYNPDFKFFSTEAGRVQPASWPNDQLPDKPKRAAAQDIRNVLIGLANGTDKYFHFNMCLNQSLGIEWRCVGQSNAEYRHRMRPGPWLYAARAAIDRLYNCRPAGQVPLGINYRCYIFDDGVRRVAVLWKWNGKPGKIILPEKFTAYDMMGSRCDGKEFILDEFPVYLETTLSAAALTAKLNAAEIAVSGKVFEPVVKITGARSFSVAVKNLTAKPLSGKITVITPNAVQGETVREFKDIAAETTQSFDFTTREVISLAPRQVTVKIEVPSAKQSKDATLSLRALLVPHSAPLKIDGDLSDWGKDAPLVLTGANAVKTAPWSAKDEKAKVEFRYRWNAERLYLAFTVEKDNFTPEDRFEEEVIWKGDSIQFAFDTIANAVKGTAGYQDDDFEYAFSLFRGKLLLMRLAGSASTYDSLPKPLGRTNDAEIAIKRDGKRVTYEIALPQISISPFRLTAGAATRFNFIANLNNGKERIGWLELAPGIGQNPKRPAEFVDMVLLPPAE